MICQTCGAEAMVQEMWWQEASVCVCRFCLQCGGCNRSRRGLKTAESILPRFTELTSATCSPRTQQILQECSLSLLFFPFDRLESLRQKISAYSNKKKITRLLNFVKTELLSQHFCLVFQHKNLNILNPIKPTVSFLMHKQYTIGPL